MDHPTWKKSKFWTFLTFCSYCLNRRFSLLEYRKNVLFSPILPKIERWKIFKVVTKTMV